MNHWRHWNSTLGGSSVVSASTPTRDLLISSGVQRHHLDKCPWREWCTSLEHGHTSKHATVSRCPSFPHECRLVNHKLYQDYSRPGIYCEYIKQSVCSRFKSRLISCRICIRFLKPVNEPLTRYVKLQVAHAPGIPGTFSPPPRGNDPDRYHGMCVTHVSWCMPGSLTSSFLFVKLEELHFATAPKPLLQQNQTVSFTNLCFAATSTQENSTIQGRLKPSIDYYG